MLAQGRTNINTPQKAFLSIQCGQFADYLWDRLRFMQLGHKLLKDICVFLRQIRRPTSLHLSKSYHCLGRSQARELISGPNLATGARLLSFNRTQSRVVIGLLTGHNTLRRHLYVMGLSNNPICRKCGTEKETSVHILCIHIWVPSFWTRRILGY